MRSCEVWPRKLLASATPVSASTTASVASDDPQPRLCPVGSALMRWTIAAACVIAFVIGVA